LQAMRKGLCSDAEHAACVEEVGEAMLEWQCENCPTRRWQDLHPYTHTLLRLRRLQQAGYPFGADDLELETWIDLGRVNECLGTQA